MLPAYVACIHQSRTFGVRAIECMYAQTRFIFSSERVLGKYSPSFPVPISHRRQWCITGVGHRQNMNSVCVIVIRIDVCNGDENAPYSTAIKKKVTYTVVMVN